MKRMFYAAHTPGSLSRLHTRSLPLSSPSSVPCPISVLHCRRLSRRAKYIPYLPPITSSLSCYLIRTPPARSRIIINLHARCPTSTFHLPPPPPRLLSPQSMFSSSITKPRSHDTYKFSQFVRPNLDCINKSCFVNYIID